MTSPTPQHAGTPEMVEIVARAIYASGQFVKPWEKCSWQHACRRKARAAIAALREPTDAMIEAAYDVAGRPVEREVVWRVMVDAALSAPEPPPAPAPPEAPTTPETREKAASGLEIDGGGT